MNEQAFAQLQQKIDMARKNNQPVDGYIKQQIKMLEDAHDELVTAARKNGYGEYDPIVVQAELIQYAALTQLATEVGLPTDKYDAEIQRLTRNTLGEEKYNQLLQQFSEQ